MRYLERAHLEAQRTRAQIEIPRWGLLEGVKNYIENSFNLEIVAVPAESIQHNHAEVSLSEGALHYDQAFDNNPEELAWELSHELGHLILHWDSLEEARSTLDAAFGTSFANDGTTSLARYHPRIREEIEANAFANEFVCPARQVFNEWLANDSIDSHDLAKQMGVPHRIVRLQLTEALFQYYQEPSISSAAFYGATESHRYDNSKPVAQRPPYDEWQECAAKIIDLPVLVNAGPGTGKTATLIRRLEYLIREKGVLPSEILVLTFSRDAAGELHQRVSTIFDEKTASCLEIDTFHGFGCSFLYRYDMQLDEKFIVLDEVGQEELLGSLLGEEDCVGIVNLRDPDSTIRELARQINHLKDRLISPDMLENEIESWVEKEKSASEHAKEFLSLYRAYERKKKERPAVDFADLIARPIELLRSSERLREEIQHKYKWIMVDEFQDVSRAVGIFLKELCGRKNHPWVVGDTRQSIYRFRGADPSNITEFTKDFLDAQTVYLKINYRSSAEIIGAANQLATLMENHEHTPETSRELWHPGRDVSSVPVNIASSMGAVALATANSDRAEYEGIAQQVRRWIDDGIPPHDIAVLARRNVDVRQIAIELGNRGIPTTIAGLITPDGPAGDLVAVLTLLENTRSSIPRLAYSLGRDIYPVETINRVIASLIQDYDNRRPIQINEGNERALFEEIQSVKDTLYREKATADPFEMLCAFLFDTSRYLRRILIDKSGATAVLALSEITTTLAKASSYSASHPDIPPQARRLGFAQYFRSRLTAAIPALDPPRIMPGAVRVMTIHASKGLEFPCVVVTGQTIPKVPVVWWIPPRLRSKNEDEIKQADSLLFVGLTRACRSVMISHALTKSGSPQSPVRQLTPLLNRWKELYQPEPYKWVAPPAMTEEVRMSRIWGSGRNRGLPAYVLNERACAIRTYLEHILGIKFPLQIEPLYPVFFASMRAALERIIVLSEERGEKVRDLEAAQIFVEKYPQKEFEGHPHLNLYKKVGTDFITKFAGAYEPHGITQLTFLETNFGIEDGAGELMPLRLDLVARFRDEASGTIHAISFRPETLAQKVSRRDNNVLPWNALDPSKRLAFLFLKDQDVNLQPWVFSGKDGRIYPYRWNQRAENMGVEREKVITKLKALTGGEFIMIPDDYECNLCRARITCPHYLVSDLNTDH